MKRKLKLAEKVAKKKLLDLSGEILFRSTVRARKRDGEEREREREEEQKGLTTEKKLQKNLEDQENFIKIFLFILSFKKL